MTVPSVANVSWSLCSHGRRFRYLDIAALDGELNRRLVLLALLYIHRRTNPYAPEVPLSEIERRMGFPRDYLEFTTWYLQSKGYIVRADNADFTLTVEGVDFVESQRGNIPVLDKLLTTGAGPTEGIDLFFHADHYT